MAADIQFIRGVNEPSIPDVNLTRARDGSTGTATFVFGSPSVFEASSELGEITGKTSSERECASEGEFAKSYGHESFSLDPITVKMMFMVH